MTIDLTNKTIVVQGYANDKNDGMYELLVDIRIAPKTERKSIGEHVIRMTPAQWEAMALVFESGNIDFEDGAEETEPSDLVSTY